MTGSGNRNRFLGNHRRGFMAVVWAAVNRREFGVRDRGESLGAGTAGTVRDRAGGCETNRVQKGVFTIAGAGDPVNTERGCETYIGTPPPNCAHSGLVNATGYDARFASPFDVELSADQRALFVSDYDNHAVRQVDLVRSSAE